MRVNLLKKLILKLKQKKNVATTSNMKIEEDKTLECKKGNVVYVPKNRQNPLEFQDEINNEHWLTGESG